MVPHSRIVIPNEKSSFCEFHTRMRHQHQAYLSVRQLQPGTELLTINALHRSSQRRSQGLIVHNLCSIGNSF